MTDKVIRNGKVAVLYSPGYGAGWSTWWDDDVRDIALFHPALVSACESGVTEINSIVDDILGDEGGYTGGWRDITIKWLDKGTAFRVDEYDGSESISVISDINFVIA